MAYTGYQRSLTMTINKTVAGVQSIGYPRNYYGRNEFVWNGNTYPAIDVEVMGTMSVVAYQERLEAFKAYVESLEAGLSVDEATVPGGEAYRENLTACPI